VSDALAPDDQALFDRLARWIVERRMETPAVLFLETVRPLSFIGAQAMHFFHPLASVLYSGPDYARLARLLEERENLSILLATIEGEADRREAEARARRAADTTRRKDTTE
jgi:hypothetical protein